MFKKIFILTFLLIITVPDVSMATLWNYSAHGTVLDSNGITREITGNMVFSDQLWLHTWPIGQQPVEDPVPASQLDYIIPEYSLKVGEFNFAGHNGFLYMEWFDTFLGDTMWFLENGTGAWNEWIGEAFNLYYADGTPYDSSQYIELAPIIQLTSLDYRFDDPIFNTPNPYLDLWLERTEAVPEPSIMLLLGSGLLGLVWLRKKFKG